MNLAYPSRHGKVGSKRRLPFKSSGQRLRPAPAYTSVRGDNGRLMSSEWSSIVSTLAEDDSSSGALRTEYKNSQGPQRHAYQERSIGFGLLTQGAIALGLIANRRDLEHGAHQPHRIGIAVVFDEAEAHVRVPAKIAIDFLYVALHAPRAVVRSPDAAGRSPKYASDEDRLA